MCVCVCVCVCVQVDAINFYMEEEAELLRSCDEERETAYRDPIGIAFITLQSEMQAQRSVPALPDSKTVCVCVCVFIGLDVYVCVCACARGCVRAYMHAC